MARLSLTLQAQRELLNSIKHELGLRQGHLADLCGVHPRTFSDWIRGEYRMQYESFQQLVQRTNVSIQHPIGSIPDFSHVRMAARLGGLSRNHTHGNPGTPEGRRRGGLVSMARRREAVKNGTPIDRFQFAKPIQRPEHSSRLAEFIGMMLGDGCLNSAFQAALYFNTDTDAQYADCMEALATTLFGVAPRRHSASARGGELLFSSKRLVDYLIQLGFNRGDKVRKQAGVPSWIVENSEYCRSCLRGLMDTDGSVYSYQHTVYGRSYTHAALCFTNRSYPLLDFVEETLRVNGYHPTRTGFRVYLHRRVELERYFSDVGTHNPKHAQRYQTHVEGCGTTVGEVSEMAERAALEKR